MKLFRSVRKIGDLPLNALNAPFKIRTKRGVITTNYWALVLSSDLLLLVARATQVANAASKISERQWCM